MDESPQAAFFIYMADPEDQEGSPRIPFLQSAWNTDRVKGAATTLKLVPFQSYYTS